MNALKWALMAYAVLATKLALWSYLDSNPLMPDPVLVLALVALITEAPPAGVLIAAILGMLGDLFWGTRLGATMVCLVATGWWLGGIRKWFDIELPARSIGVATFLGWAVLAERSALYAWLLGSSRDLEQILVPTLWQAVPIGVATFGLAYLFDRSKNAWATLFQPSGAA